MSSGASSGFWINVAAFGFLMIGFGAVWDKLTIAVNSINSMGLLNQQAMNTWSMLGLCVYAAGFLFLLASGYNLFIESKRDADRGV